MALDGITLHFLAKELDDSLPGARIDRIHGGENREFVFRLHGKLPVKHLRLDLSPSEPLVDFPDERPEGKQTSGPFLSLLRKYLISARFNRVYTMDFDRILMFEFKSFSPSGDPELFNLCAELMGRHSNLILLDSDMKILDSLVRIDEGISSIRQIGPGLAYTLPPSQGKLSPGSAIAALGNKRFFESSALSLEKYLLSRLAGFSPLFVKEIIYSANLDPLKSLKNCSEEELVRLSEVLLKSLKKIPEGKYSPCMAFCDPEQKNPLEFHAFSLGSYEHKRPYESLIRLLKVFYVTKNAGRKLENEKASYAKILRQRIKSLGRLLDAYEEELSESFDFENHKSYGDTIYSMMHEAHKLDLPLDPRLSLSANAQRHYKIYKRKKAKFTTVNKNKEEALRERDYCRSVLTILLNAKDEEALEALKEEMNKVPSLRKIIYKKEYDSKTRAGGKTKDRGRGKKRSKPMVYLSSDQYEILIGKNNLQNDELTFKIAGKNDLWFHIKDMPGCHTVVRVKPGKEVPVSTIQEAAMLTAWYSRDEGGGATKLTVDYCLVKFVTKPKKSKPGQVIYRNHKSVFVKAALPDQVFSL